MSQSRTHLGLHPVVSALSWFLHHHEINGLDPRSREALATDRENILDQPWPAGYPSAQAQLPEMSRAIWMWATNGQVCEHRHCTHEGGHWLIRMIWTSKESWNLLKHTEYVKKMKERKSMSLHYHTQKEFEKSKVFPLAEFDMKSNPTVKTHLQKITRTWFALWDSPVSGFSCFSEL